MTVRCHLASRLTECARAEVWLRLVSRLNLSPIEAVSWLSLGCISAASRLPLGCLSARRRRPAGTRRETVRRVWVGGDEEAAWVAEEVRSRLCNLIVRDVAVRADNHSRYVAGGRVERRDRVPTGFREGCRAGSSRSRGLAIPSAPPTATCAWTCRRRRGRRSVGRRHAR